jgi:hypothetical protein
LNCKRQKRNKESFLAVHFLPMLESRDFTSLANHQGIVQVSYHATGQNETKENRKSRVHLDQPQAWPWKGPVVTATAAAGKWW